MWWRKKRLRRCLAFLWPPDARGGRFDHEQLSSSGLCNFGDFLHATPLGRNYEKRFPVCTPEHACEAAPINDDRLQHLAALANTHTALVGNIGVPDSVVGVDTDAVGNPLLRSAHTRRCERLPSLAISKAVSFLPWDSAMINVELSGVTAMPLGKAKLRHFIAPPNEEVASLKVNRVF